MYVDDRNRAPKVEVLPDMRLRVTRLYDVQNQVAKALGTFDADVLLPWGTADKGFPQCLLVKQDEEGQFKGPFLDPCAEWPQLTRVYEQLSRTAETQVGEPEIDVGQDGIATIVLNYIQYSVAAGGSQTFLTVGSAGISAPMVAVLKLEERTDDGTLQRIKRTYSTKGQISQTLDSKYNGALSMETDVYVNEIPPTPAGFVLVTSKTDFVNGLPVYTYTFAMGSGLVSESIEYRLSPDQGATGVTVYTIKYLSPPGTSNPITPPAGTEEISVVEEQSDGYIMWTGTYASGQGVISTETEIRNDGKLYLTTITSINTAPSAPSARISGTVTLIKTDVRNGTRFEDGTIIYTYTWAEGLGQIAENIEYLDSLDQGTNGVTRTTIKFLVAPAGTVQPTSLSGSVLVKQDYEDVEGYRIWTTTWGKGAGLTVDEKTISKSGVLIIYHRVGLGTAPSAPSPTISGTVTLFESGTRNSEGYQIFDYRWAEGNGQANITTRGEGDGAIIYTITDLNAAAATPAYPGSGTAYLVELEQEPHEGYFVNRAVYKLPPALMALRKQLSFPFPGQIEITSPDPGFQLIPPVRREILATVTVDYGTTQITTTPYSISQYASVNFAYVVASNGQVVTGQRGGAGYLSGATGASGSNSVFNGVTCSDWAYQIAGSTPSAPPSGATTIGVENEPYLVDITGTIIYKRVVTTFSF